MKKLLIVVLSLCLALASLAGCGRKEEPAPDAAEAPGAAEAQDAAETQDTAPEAQDAAPVGIGHGGKGYAAYPAETVVGYVGDEDVDWMEYYYWLRSYTEYIQQVASQYGFELSGWDAYELSPSMTNAELVLSHAQTTIIQNHAARQRLAELGIALTDEEEAEISGIYDQNADSFTGNSDGEATDEERAVFESYLDLELNISPEFFNSLNRDMYLVQKGFDLLYGKNGSALPDEDAMTFAEENGYMSAKHILLLTVDPDTLAPLPDETIAEKKARAEAIYAQLTEVRNDPDALADLFDELTAGNTEDNGYAVYPDGYVFCEGEMVSAFEDAVKSLEIGELSGIVESEYGYHIILRTPLDPDAVIGTDARGNPNTLRYAAAAQRYSDELLDWTDKAHVEWTDGFQMPDLAAIFG